MECIIIGLVAFSILFVYIKADDIITGKRLRENQLAWNEYSKNMTDDEKMEVYIKWCKLRKNENGWSHYYYPGMGLKNGNRDPKRRNKIERTRNENKT